MIEDALALLTKTAMMEEVRIGGYRNGDSLSSTSPDGGRRLCDVFVASESSLCTTHQRDRTGQYNTARCWSCFNGWPEVYIDISSRSRTRCGVMWCLLCPDRQV